MEMPHKIKSAWAPVIFELLYQANFWNTKETLGLLLLAYKFIKLTNRGKNSERVLLLLFALLWHNLRECDNTVFGYLFTDSAYNASFLGLYTAELPLYLNLLLTYGMTLTDGRHDISVSQELMQFTETSLKYCMGIEELSVD